MLNNSPRAAIATALLMLFSSHTGAYDKQSAMDAAKEEAAKLSIKDILTESSASGTVPEYGSDPNTAQMFLNSKICLLKVRAIS